MFVDLPQISFRIYLLSTHHPNLNLAKFTSQAAPMSCKCRGNMRSIISTGHFSNAWPPACKWSIQQFTGMDFFTHGITGHNEVLYCFEDHLVHSVKFRLKICYIIDSLIRTHDPDDNWPRTTLAFHFSIRNLGGQMVEFSISERKTPTPGLSPPASQCGWCSSNLWRRKRFGTLMVFWSPSQLMEKNDSSKRLPGMAGKQTSNTFGTKSFGLQKRKECSSHWHDIIWTFLSLFEGL